MKNPYLISNLGPNLIQDHTIRHPSGVWASLLHSVTFWVVLLGLISWIGYGIAQAADSDPMVMKIYPDGTKVIVRWSEIGKSVDNGEKHGGAPRIVAYDPGKDGIVPIGAQEAAAAPSSSTGGSSMSVKESMPLAQGKTGNGDLSGFYITPTLGVAVIQDMNLRLNNLVDVADTGFNASGDLSISLNPGIRFDLPFGVNVTDWFSFEFAPGVIWNSFESINAKGTISGSGLTPVNGNGSLGLGGNFIQVPIMANFIFKIPTLTRWTPYIGGGIGGNYNYTTITSILGVPFQNGLNDNCWSVGYQGIAGFDYECTEEISIGLRYIFTGSTQQVFQGDLSGLSTQGSFTHTVNLTCTARF